VSRSAPALAKRLVEPTWLNHPVYVETFGPEVADICDLADFAPDPEQELLLDLIFAIGPDGKSAAYEIDVIGPRQNFKTGLIKQAELGWLYVTEERLIVHSAHELSTTEEAFNDLRQLIEDCPPLSARLDASKGKNPGISEGNGRWAIHLRNQRVKYKARTVGGGRGLTGNKVVLDEGFALQPSHLGSLEPTLAAVPDPQILTASSAGRLMSAVLREKRSRGRAGTSPRQLYAEYGDREAWQGCADPQCAHLKTAVGCAADDEERWARIQPALGRRVNIETIRSMRQSMPIEEFLHEFMVWWEDPPDESGAVLSLSEWLRLEAADAPQPSQAALVVDVSPDRKWSTLGIAGDGPAGRTLVMEFTQPGTSWVVPKLLDLQARSRLVEVALHPGGQAGALIPELTAARVEFESLTNRDMGQATAAFIEAVRRGTVAHVNQSALNTAVANARTRFVQESELWDRRDRSVNISPLVACSAAAYRWGLSQRTSVYESRGFLSV
jgi:phage terminase large subunit-like protein